MIRKAILAAATLTVSACGAPLMGTAPEAPSQEAITWEAPQPGTFSATARLAIFDLQGYRLLSTLNAYGAADVTQIRLFLLKDVAGSYTQIATKTQAIAQPSDLAGAIPLTNLKSNTSYKVRVEAYASGNVQIDTGVAADNTSAVFTTPAASGSSIDSSTLAISLPLKLKDRTYVGQAESAGGITVSNGTIVDTTASEAFL